MNGELTLPAGIPLQAVAAAVVVGLLLVRWRRAALIAALVFLAAVAGWLPGEGGSGRLGGPLGAGAPVPVAYRPAIERAGSRCADITPALLAAQLNQESGFNPRARSSVGAMGIAQFMPGTWQTWATDGNGDGVASVWDPQDAIAGQGRMMCALAQAARAGRADGRLDGGVVELALAGYNAGFGRVQAAGGVPHIAETTHYVQMITVMAASYSHAGSTASALPVVGSPVPALQGDQ